MVRVSYLCFNLFSTLCFLVQQTSLHLSMCACHPCAWAMLFLCIVPISMDDPRRESIDVFDVDVRGNGAGQRWRMSLDRVFILCRHQCIPWAATALSASDHTGARHENHRAPFECRYPAETALSTVPHNRGSKILDALLQCSESRATSRSNQTHRSPARA